MDDDVRRRLQRLEDRERIRELQATYCFLVDDRRFDELVDQWFTEDARCDFRDRAGAMTPFVSNGRSEIRAFFTQVVDVLLQDMCHTVHNERIAINDDAATGECYFELTAKQPDGDEAVVGAGRYVDRYRRVGAAWRFSERNAIIFYIAPLAEGWVRRPLVRVLTGG